MAIDENGMATLTGTITDPDTSDTFTLEVNWGDPDSPNNNETFTFGSSDTGSQTFTLEHQYLDDNPSGTPSDTYTINATVTDNNGGEGSDTETVDVNNVSPEILESDLTLTLTPLPNGGDDDDDVQVFDVTIEGSFTDLALGVETESFSGTGTEWTVESFDDDDDDDDEAKFLLESTDLNIEVLDEGSGNFTGTFSTTNQLLVEDDDLFDDDDGGSISVKLTLSDDDLGTDEVEFTQSFAGDDDDSIMFNRFGSSTFPDLFSSELDLMGGDPDDILATIADMPDL